MRRLHTVEDLARAVEWLATVEPRFCKVLTRHGLPPLRRSEPGLESLLRIITDQLISLRAGQAIWARLSARLGPFSPANVLACPEEELRGLGLSGAKARSFHAAARAFAAGHPGGDDELPEDEILRRLTAIPGVGPWTANIYLLSAVRAADAWPAADLALQVAAHDLLGLAARPGRRDMSILAEAWRPVRSAAALLLWSHYRGMRGLPPE